jgi:hypothetical protein
MKNKYIIATLGSKKFKAGLKSEQDLPDFITGLNLKKNLLIKQIKHWQSFFSKPALQAVDLILDKQLINAITLNKVLIKKKDKGITLQLLTQY